MPSLNELIFNIYDTPDKGRSDRARNFSRRQIEFWIRATRKLLFYQTWKEHNLVDVGFQQDLGCCTLEVVDQSDCDKYQWGTDVKKIVIPPTIGLPENADITFFGLIDKQTTIYLPSNNYGILEDFVPFKPKKQRVAMRIENTIYVSGDDKLCAVNIRGIFDDPTEVQLYGATGIEPRCFDKDKDPYPIPGRLEHTMYQIIFKEYIMPFAGAPKETENVEDTKALV